MAVAKSAWGIVVEVVEKPAEQIGFAVLPRRWVTHEAFVKWAMVGNMVNRLAPPPGPRPWSSTRK